MFVAFKPHEPIHAVFDGKPSEQLLLVLVNTAIKIVRPPKVGRPVSAAGQHVAETRRTPPPPVIPGRPAGPNPDPRNTTRSFLSCQAWCEPAAAGVHGFRARR